MFRWMYIKMKDENVFFKYQKIDEYCIKNLSENQLYFRDPTKFDDPFDCLVFFEAKATRDVWINRIMSQQNCDHERANRLLNMFVESKHFATENDLIYPTEEYYKDVDNYVSDLHGDLKCNIIPGVCCFCKDDKDIRMWSQYANEHRGICLSFQFSDKSIINNIRKVEYVSEIEPIDLFDINLELKVVDALHKKSLYFYQEFLYKF